jgi:hypothetical protein
LRVKINTRSLLLSVFDCIRLSDRYCEVCVKNLMGEIKNFDVYMERFILNEKDEGC